MLAKGGDAKGVGQKVEILAAGGEIVLNPREVMRLTGARTLQEAHRIMDRWVVHERKNHIKTLKKLKGPTR